MRCGGFIGRSTAVAAAASGGATMAPSAMAGAHGIAGISVRTTTATAIVVRATAKTTRLVTGAQLSRRSRGDASYAASSSTGARKSASASSGGTRERRRAGQKCEQRAADREEYRIRCTDAPAPRCQDHRCEDQDDESFEFPHEFVR